ncbi:exocyst complex component Sec6-domain-containing protein [Gamsiella multidivaricata]|uniref:exocyst complex component Sec6-domain-containing protein n=1 Tax=Gamsiella multidivaricata TaxID=101098 RepID=UPI00221F645A|nr:exocyst complex component Sec6-domain-containing protein [Gamsiella multidivaricata]KAG0371145.1 SNARE-binding exocyst subunit S6 [Gamsiella multidivaricata]KAI7830406.1 exocyst complex component Sec6-domain-containing protein [Gamsiella multidivaricata]
MVDGKSIISIAPDAKVAIISALLKHPDDLSNLSSIRQKLIREKAIVDQQLKIGVQNQMEETKEALDILGTTKEQVLGIRANMKNIDSLCKDAQGLIKDYPRIRKISQTHQNFVATQSLVNNFQELHQDLDRIKSMMKEDKRNILGPAPNLLMVHYQLYKLEQLRDKTLYMARDEPLDVKVTLKEYFGRLDQVIQEFEEYLWELTRNMIDLIKSKQGSVIVRLIKIIESEESADAKAVTLTTKSEHRGSRQGLGGKKTDKAPRTVKSLRSKFLDILHDEVSRKFNILLERVDSEPLECLEATDFVFPDLALVYDDLVPRSPSNYKIFPFLVIEYHRHVYELVNKIVNSPDLDGGRILHLLRWVREYYASMNHQLGVTEELLEPQLLDGNEQGLLDEYLKLVRTNLIKWTNNMMATATAEFVERQTAPEKDSDKLYHMQTANLLFEMVNQQVTLAADSQQSTVMEQVVRECIQVIKDYQKKWKELTTAEMRKQMDSPGTAPAGLAEYIMAATNDQIKCAEFADALLIRIEKDNMIKNRKNFEAARDLLNETMDDFFDVATHGANALLDLAFNDVKEPLSKLHTSSWYDDDPMGLIIATLKDYNDDFRIHLNDYMFNKLVDWMLERLMIAQIDALRNKGAKLKFPICEDRLQQDRAAVFNFFVQYKPINDLEQDFDAIEKLHKFTCSTKMAAYLNFYSMKRIYHDLPLTLVEDILGRRDDLDRSSIKEIMDPIKEKFKDKDPIDAARSPTVFSKVKQ